MSRPLLCLDFDGVIHRYSQGWREGQIYDPVTPGFFDWAEQAKAEFSLVIYSSRSATPAGRKAMHEWLYRQWLGWKSLLRYPSTLIVSDPIKTPPQPMDFEFAHTKPPAFLTLDDRGIQFQGRWDDPELQPLTLRAFKPWNLKP